MGLCDASSEVSFALFRGAVPTPYLAASPLLAISAQPPDFVGEPGGRALRRQFQTLSLSNLPKPALTPSTTISRIVQPCGTVMRLKQKPEPFRGVLAEPILHGGMPIAVNLGPVAREKWRNEMIANVARRRRINSKC